MDLAELATLHKTGNLKDLFRYLELDATVTEINEILIEISNLEDLLGHYKYIKEHPGYPIETT